MTQIPRLQPPEDDNLDTFPTSRAIRDCLARLTVWQLDTIFEQIGFEEHPSRRGDREELLASWLEQPDHVHQLIDEHLASDAIAILEFLAGFDADLPARRLLEADLVGLESDWLHFRSASPLAHLRQLGLVHVGTHARDGREFVFVGLATEVAEGVRTWFASDARDHSADAAELADDLLADPPTDAHELDERTRGIPEPDLRDELVDRIVAGDLADSELFGLVETLARLGAGPRRADLVDVIDDPTPDDSDERHLARIAAYAVWSIHAPDNPRDQLDLLDVSMETLHDLSEEAYEIVLGESEGDPRLARIPGDQLLEADPAGRRELFAETERLRRDSGAEAGRVYAPLLADPAYADIWPLLAEALHDDGHPGDAWLLERCARRTDDPDHASTLRKTAMRLRSAEPPSDETVDGFGLLGVCDGEGAFAVCTCVASDDEEFIFNNIVLRTADLRLREGFTLPDTPVHELQSIVESIETGGRDELIRMPLEVAAGLVQRAAKTALDEATLEPQLLEAIHFNQRLPDEPPPPLDRDPDHEVTADDVSAVLSQSVFDTWVFGLAELFDADLIPLPAPGDVDDDWVDRAASALAELPNTRERIVSMAEHMALWSHFKEGANTEPLFGHLADITREQFADSPLVREIARRTPAFYEPRPDFGELAPYRRPAEPDLRQHLAERFLGPLDTLEADDQRRLDWIELAFSTLEFVRPTIPSDQQPRFEQVYDLAYDLGTHFADFDLDNTPIDREGIRHDLHDLLDDLNWPDARPEVVYDELTDNFAALLEENAVI
jgi:hypothetical protein